MALTRLNNRSVSEVTALPSGIDIPAGAIVSADLPSGTIVQVVRSTLGNQGTTSTAANENASYVLSFTTTTWTDTNLLATTITPKFSNSLIFLSISVFANQDNSSGEAAPSYRIIRGTTVLWQPQTNSSGPYGLTYSSSQHYEHNTVECWDQPNTISPITYSLQYRSYGGASISRLFGYPGAQQWSPINCFTIMEIKA
jgi:hypothetical protein